MTFTMPSDFDDINVFNPKLYQILVSLKELNFPLPLEITFMSFDEYCETFKEFSCFVVLDVRHRKFLYSEYYLYGVNHVYECYLNACLEYGVDKILTKIEKENN